ncbi:MAG: TIGR02147 family protein [Deltaproteobacteria bacterium]|nr:MAG: TIGR02147 family protein [Deltaproteobacteria bacterium]TNF28062.1 MAG: TIGR02147 family protein [Deltaproteobacteria bacterium]
MRPNVFEYTDFKDFISDMLSFLKKEEGLSLREISSRAGVSPANLSMISNGSRSPKVKTLLSIARALNLSSRERGYLELLHDMKNSSDENASSSFKKLEMNKDYQRNSPADHEAFKYLTNWYNVVIREMVHLKNFEPDPSWIQNKLISEVETKEIKEALRFLISNNFIHISKSKKEINLSKELNCTDGVYRLSLGQFHSLMLKKASDSIGEVEREKRLLLGHTVAISEDQMSQVFSILEEALEKIRGLEKKKQKNDKVIHVELAAFPLTK